MNDLHLRHFLESALKRTATGILPSRFRDGFCTRFAPRIASLREQRLPEAGKTPNAQRPTFNAQLALVKLGVGRFPAACSPPNEADATALPLPDHPAGYRALTTHHAPPRSAGLMPAQCPIRPVWS